MCILFISFKTRDDFPVIIAANRDEFHKRPTRESHFWNTQIPIIAGKDLQAGGTWMGVSAEARFSALTNFRDPSSLSSTKRSRGELVINSLLQTPEHFEEQLVSNASEYNDFNLLFGSVSNLSFYNSRRCELKTLSPGYYGLSNADLNTPWPKLIKGTDQLEQYCESAKSIESDTLFALLHNTEQAEDHSLPSTGVPLDWEKLLSSIFIVSNDYGTRASTVLMIDNNNKIYWCERSFDSKGNHTQTCTFTLP